MNTPAHAIISMVALGGKGRTERLRPVLAGSLLPDLPMMVFYAWEKLLRGTGEGEIWNERYFDPAWQAIFDLPNSLPVLGVALLVAWGLRRSGWVLFFLSMILHVLLDLPLHQEDAHRHFFPLSDWRFVSPVSYWNPASHGVVVTLFEIGLVAAGTITLLVRHPERLARAAVLTLGAGYLLYFGYVLLVWV